MLEAEQVPRQLPSSEGELANCLVAVRIGDPENAILQGVLLGGNERGLPHQLLDEGRACAFRLLNEPVRVRERERDATPVELEQPAPAFRVREWELDRLIHSAWSRREGGLYRFRAVGGEEKDDLGVGRQAIHLVEKLVEGDLKVRMACFI